MTLEEKAGLCSGLDFWHTKAVKRLGVPNIMVSDGPTGLRKQDQNGDHLGVNDSIKAVSFPSGCLTACSFDRDLLRMEGEVLGDECQAEDIAVLLGPALNIKRSPLCGRNFEYLSEDPYLAGELGAAYTQGVQSKNIGRDFMAGMKTLVGGEIVGYTEMIREARQIATKRMVDEAEKLGADAVVGVRYGSSAVMQGAAEIIVYGTAVKLK